MTPWKELKGKYGNSSNGPVIVGARSPCTSSASAVHLGLSTPPLASTGPSKRPCIFRREFFASPREHSLISNTRASHGKAYSDTQKSRLKDIILVISQQARQFLNMRYRKHQQNDTPLRPPVEARYNCVFDDSPSYQRWLQVVQEAPLANMKSARFSIMSQSYVLYRTLEVYPEERAIVFSYSVRFLDILAKVMRLEWNIEVLRFDGRLSSDERVPVLRQSGTSYRLYCRLYPLHIYFQTATELTRSVLGESGCQRAED